MKIKATADCEAGRLFAGPASPRLASPSQLKRAEITLRQKSKSLPA